MTGPTISKFEIRNPQCFSLCSIPYLSWSTVVIGEPTWRPFTGTLDMLDLLNKEQPIDGADVPLRAKRWRLLSHPADTAPIIAVKKLIEEKKWEHPDFYEFLGNAWATKELRSIDASYDAYRRAAEVTPVPWQRSRVRAASARAFRNG